MLASGMDARSYARILGSNDRVHLGIVGCGSRSEDYVGMAQIANKQIPVDIVAVCDIWNKARERRAAQVKQEMNLKPQKYKYLEEPAQQIRTGV